LEDVEEKYYSKEQALMALLEFKYILASLDREFTELPGIDSSFNLLVWLSYIL
jgi:hypothetical protein